MLRPILLLRSGSIHRSRQLAVWSSPNNPLCLKSRSAAMAFSSDTVPRTLSLEDGPLVWVDLEMTGLNPRVDKIMEIAVIITDGQLKQLDNGLEYVINVDKDQLDRMGEWCTNQHGASGLTQACLDSPHKLPDVEDAVLAYVKERIPAECTGVLAGNSVHVDKAFLKEYMPNLANHLHYRIVDVSSIKELCRRWYPGAAAPKSNGSMEGEAAHRALEDIQASIRELRFYRENVFREPGTVEPNQPIEPETSS